MKNNSIEGIKGRMSQADGQKLDLALMYSEFPKINPSLRVLIDILKRKESITGIDFTERVEDAVTGIFRAVDVLKINLDNQKRYGLVDKRWMRDTKSIEEALRKGRLVMELDIRMDREGAFWVSHAVGAKYTSIPPFIHNMTTKEMKKTGRRYLLEEGLDEFAQYIPQGHKVILELKTLGEDASQFTKAVENLHNLIKKKNLENSVAVASLSPSILMAVNKVMPKMPLIFNGGIIPGISYAQNDNNIVSNIIPADKRWRAFGIRPFGEIVVATGNISPKRADGYGTHTSYALTKLPNDLVRVLSQQCQDEVELGGLVSLSAVSIMASILEAVGAENKAKKMRAYYSDIVDELGLGKMVTTWGQSLKKVPGLEQLSPEKQLKVFKKEFGLDTIIYTKSPEKWAHLLPRELVKLLE